MMEILALGLAFVVATVATFVHRAHVHARSKPAPTPAPKPPTWLHRPVDVPEERILDVWVARSADQFQTFPSVTPGLAALWYHDEPFAAKAAGFNWDAWPRRCSIEGLYLRDEVLEAARDQDRLEGRDVGLLIEDFILHEVGGHGVLGVGADHDSPNTLMQARNGPKTEADRQQLRDAVALAYDAFRVHVGPPGA